MKFVIAIAAVAILAITVTTGVAITSVVANDDVVTWESPCGESVVLGHRIDGAGNARYVCGE